MSTRFLRWLAVILPLLFWGLLTVVRVAISQGVLNIRVEILIFAIFLMGSFLFSSWIFRVIDQREYEIRNRSEQLAALHEAALALTGELEIETVLQKVVDLARQLTGARYGALGVLDENGETIEQFITSGMTRDERSKAGPPPEGHGLLGELIRKGQPLYVPDITKDPKTVGFPKNHPQMKSLLGVPIKSKGKIIGDLYLTDKLGTDREPSKSLRFTEKDKQILEMFATQAAVAIENAQLYRQTQQLAILQERERFGMDLHDGIIQSIYAIGLMLEETQHYMGKSPRQASDGITRALHGLNDVIRDIRNYILDLRPQRFQGRNLIRGLDELARDLRANTFLNVVLETNGIVKTDLSPEQTVAILHIVQEALTNVRKHARATNVKIELHKNRDSLLLVVEDNGIGLNKDVFTNSPGNGLRNMRERAASLNGEIDFIWGEEIGTQVTLKVPLDEN